MNALLAVKDSFAESNSEKIKNRLDKIINYYKFDINQQVLSFLLGISYKFDYLPSIAPISDKYLQLEYDKNDNCLDFEILYKDKIIINMFKSINGNEIEVDNISTELMIKEVNDFNRLF